MKGVGRKDPRILGQFPQFTDFLGLSWWLDIRGFHAYMIAVDKMLKPGNHLEAKLTYAMLCLVVV